MKYDYNKKSAESLFLQSQRVKLKKNNLTHKNRHIEKLLFINA